MKIKFTGIISLIFLTMSSVAQTHYVTINDSNVIRSDTFLKESIHGPIIFYSFKDSLKDGKWVLCFDGDTSKPREICHFKDKIRNGLQQAYDTNGNISGIAEWSNGKRVGKTQYYYNGILKNECLENIGTQDKFLDNIGTQDMNSLCRSIDEMGKPTYTSRKHKRCFEKLLKLENQQLKSSDK